MHSLALAEEEPERSASEPACRSGDARRLHYVLLSLFLLFNISRSDASAGTLSKVAVTGDLVSLAFASFREPVTSAQL